MNHEVNLNFSGFLSVLASLLSVVVVRLYLESDYRCLDRVII